MNRDTDFFLHCKKSCSLRLWSVSAHGRTTRLTTTIQYWYYSIDDVTMIGLGCRKRVGRYNRPTQPTLVSAASAACTSSHVVSAAYRWCLAGTHYCRASLAHASFTRAPILYLYRDLYSGPRPDTRYAISSTPFRDTVWCLRHP